MSMSTETNDVDGSNVNNGIADGTSGQKCNTYVNENVRSSGGVQLPAGTSVQSEKKTDVTQTCDINNSSVDEVQTLNNVNAQHMNDEQLIVADNSNRPDVEFAELNCEQSVINDMNAAHVLSDVSAHTISK